MDNEKVKWMVLEELREYIVYNDVEISCRDDLLKAFIEIREDCYLHEIEEAGKMKEARNIFNKFADAYVCDKDILEKDLILMGPRVVLEKLENIKKR